MSLKSLGVIEIPGGSGSEFDHGIFDTKSRRVFIAHTRQSAVEVIDPDAGRHIATLPGFPGVAGAVADDGEILVTNRGSASISWLDASTLKTKSTFNSGARPNGAAIVKRLALGIALASATTMRRRACTRSASTMANTSNLTCRAGRAGA
jgi:YVTN family beta-propeller protein